MAIKVAMIADHPDPGQPIDGGVQAVTAYLVKALSLQADIELNILSFRFGLPQPKIIQTADFTHHQIPFGRFGSSTAFVRDQKYLNDCLAEIRPDLVHSQGGGHHGILASRCNYPRVITIHGIPEQEAIHISGLRRRLRTRFQGWMTRRYCIRRATNTILISPYVADYYGSLLHGNRYMIPNPVDPRFFDVIRDEKPNRLLFLGRLYSLKGVHDLLKAVSMLDYKERIDVVLAGSLADTNYVNELRNLATGLDTGKNVEFRGILDMQSVFEELSSCSCVVLPSYQETAPMVIQEAMASGVPVIASNICGIPYQVDDGRTGFTFTPGAIDELADRLRTLLSNRALREEFGAAARLRAQDEYHADSVARKTISVYKDIVDRGD